jgi:hypothetical protein
MSVVYEAGDPSARSLLCKLWVACSWTPRVPERLCARCYATLPGKNFLIYHENDEDGYDMTAPGDKENDYLLACLGDHLFCPFECDTCAFF